MNSKTVCVIDLIGSYAGMDYYDISFSKELKDLGLKVAILSTFSDESSKPFLPVMFRKSKLASILVMIHIYCKLFKYLICNRKSVFVFMSFGEVTDFLFFSLALLSKNFYVDIHELYAARYQDNSKIKRLYSFFYKHYINKVIYHSEKTDKLLDEIEYKGVRLFVPHFKYSINRTYDITNVSDDVKNKFISRGKKFLFFGNLRQVKGIDIVLEYFEKNEQNDGIELVIAGKNVENINFDGIRDKYGVIDRHINDDELKYLYSKTDYVLLPYRDSSQSGILEMAFTFRKPMLLSDIPYFSAIVSSYPSFGEMASLSLYGKLLDDVIKKETKRDYYTINDCNKFMMHDEIEKFKKDFISSISW